MNLYNSNHHNDYSDYYCWLNLCEFYVCKAKNIKKIPHFFRSLLNYFAFNFPFPTVFCVRFCSFFLFSQTSDVAILTLLCALEVFLLHLIINKSWIFFLHFAERNSDFSWFLSALVCSIQITDICNLRKEHHTRDKKNS